MKCLHERELAASQQLLVDEQQVKQCQFSLSQLEVLVSNPVPSPGNNTQSHFKHLEDVKCLQERELAATQKLLLDEKQVTWIVLGYLIVALILQPVYGALSDRFGRKPMLIWFGVMGVLFTYPLLSTLSQTKNPWVAFFLICGAWLIISGYTSITGIIKAELFPTSIRALGVGVPYALTVSIFGGTVDSVALGFKQAGHEAWFYWYATGCIFISLVVYLSMRDTLAQSRMEQHE